MLTITLPIQFIKIDEYSKIYILSQILFYFVFLNTVITFDSDNEWLVPVPDKHTFDSDNEWLVPVPDKQSNIHGIFAITPFSTCIKHKHVLYEICYGCPHFVLKC